MREKPFCRVRIAVNSPFWDLGLLVPPFWWGLHFAHYAVTDLYRQWDERPNLVRAHWFSLEHDFPGHKF